MRPRLLALLLLCSAFACGGDDDDDNDDNDVGLATGALCPDESTLTYESFGQEFMTTYCTHCHGADAAAHKPASALVFRHGEAVEPYFDTIEQIREWADAMDVRAASGPNATNTMMPPEAPRPSTADRAKFGEWLACGAPTAPSTP